MSARRENDLIRVARNVARLQRQIAKYRRQIKHAQGELKAERRLLRGLANAGQQSAPSRLTGGVTGYAWDETGHLAACAFQGEAWHCAAGCPHRQRIVDAAATEDITTGLEE